MEIEEKKQILWINYLWIVPVGFYWLGVELIIAKDFIQGWITLFQSLGLKSFVVIFLAPTFYIWFVISIVLLWLPFVLGGFILEILRSKSLPVKKIILFIILILFLKEAIYFIGSFVADSSFPLARDAHNHLYTRFLPFM